MAATARCAAPTRWGMNGRVLLLEVVAERDALMRQFFTWRGAQQPASLEEDLDAWSAARWPIALPPAARGLLLSAARSAEREGLAPVRRAQVPPRQSGEGIEDYLVRIAVANGWTQAGAVGVREFP